jgi:hypothetical protein
MSIQTQSYDLLSEDYQNALRWMVDLGVNISPGRTQHYAKIIDYWKSRYKSASEQEGKDIFTDFVSSAYEISDFIDIYKSLHSELPDKLVHIAEKLQKGVNGPVNAAQETSKSTVARNYIFEALVAARCHAPSSSITSILDAKSDTGIEVKNKKIWIECKRVTSIKKLEANVRDARNQLEKILNSKIGSGHRGMVAIDFTKILHEGDKLLVKDNDRALQASITQIMDLFIKQYSEQWEKVYKSKPKKIIGTMLRFSTMATSESRNLLVRVSEWGVNPRIGIRSSDEAALRYLAAELGENKLNK